MNDETNARWGLALRYYARRVRLAQRCSQEEFAERLTKAGWPTKGYNVRLRESRNSPVSMDEAVALAAALGLPGVDALLTATDAPCERCHGAPPPGFACTVCGAGSE